MIYSGPVKKKNLK